MSPSRCIFKIRNGALVHWCTKMTIAALLHCVICFFLKCCLTFISILNLYIL